MMPGLLVRLLLLTFTQHVQKESLDITMYETLLRPIDVLHVPALQPISEVTQKLKEAERRREDKRLKQIAAGQRDKEHQHKRKRAEAGTEGGESEKDKRADEGLENGEEELASKRVKKDDEGGLQTQQDLMQVDLVTAPTPITIPIPTSASTPSSSGSTTKISVSKALSEVRGHTSYLTFASLQPFPFPLPEAATEATEPSVPGEKKENSLPREAGA
jgi:tRNA (adenine57-N1/adenine58-N1)-methyltransferase